MNVVRLTREQARTSRGAPSRPRDHTAKRLRSFALWWERVRWERRRGSRRAPETKDGVLPGYPNRCCQPRRPSSSPPKSRTAGSSTNVPIRSAGRSPACTSSAVKGAADVLVAHHEQLVVLAATQRLVEGRPLRDRDRVQAEPDFRGIRQAVQIEGEPVGDVDHRPHAGPAGQRSFGEAGHRTPVGRRRLAGGHLARRRPQRPQTGRRRSARPGHHHHVPRLGSRARHRGRADLLDRAEHRDRHHDLGRRGHVAADHRAPAGRRGLRHPSHDPHGQLSGARATGNAQGHQRSERIGTHGRQVAQCPHQRLPAHVSRAAHGQVDVDPLHDRVDRDDQRTPPGQVHNPGVVA